LEAVREAGRTPTAGVDVVARHRGLVRRTALVSSLTLVSRVLGYAREILSAALFGDRSAVFDAFITAWRVPNLFRRFLGEGALATSFQTAMTREEAERGEEAGKALFRATARLLLLLLVGLAAVVMGAIALMPDAMPITGWAWLGADPGPVRELAVRLMPFVVLACLAALAGGALQVRGDFAAPAWAPATLNVVWIATLLGLVAAYGFGQAGLVDDARELEMARWLSWGVLVAGLVQLVVHLPSLARQGLLERGPIPAAGGAWQVLRRSTPLALGAAVYQVNVLIDGFMAEGLLSDGGPTLHYYANRVQQFPMALVAVAATSAVFPALQAHGASNDRRAVRDLHDRTHRAIAFVALPASLGLCALAQAVIGASFEHGAFGAEGVARASAGLRWLCLAIVPAGAVGLVARTYYALGDFRTPVRISVALLALNALLNWVLVARVGMDVDGLALSTTLCSWGNVLLLVAGLSRRLGLPGGELPMARPLVGMTLAAGASAAAALATQRGLQGLLGRAPALFLAIACAAGVYAFTTLRLGVPEAHLTARRIAARWAGRSSRPAA